ncbi:MAG: diacylglycerol kinase family lipid kinase [Oscillospiraceae bacterium]|nr:diacylglycerol kinase family lipid kinase [Oscillospiraceae bacterium]
MKSIMLLVNPNAGRGGYKTVLSAVLETFYCGGWLPTVYFTQRSGEAPGLVEAHAAAYDLVSCMGGDGTLSEVAEGLMRGAVRRPIAYIPLGTANDVAHTLGLSSKPADCARQLLAGTPLPYDMGRFGEDSYFTYVAAFGAFTEVSYETPQDAKQALGHMAYMLEALSNLGNLTAYHGVVEHDGGVIEGDFVFGAITNSTSVAGLVKLDDRTVDLGDGLSEVLLVRQPRDLREFGDIVSAVLSGDLSGPNVSFFKSSRVDIRFDVPVAWTRDGEDGGRHQSVVLQNRHPGVQIIV